MFLFDSKKKTKANSVNDKIQDHNSLVTPEVVAQRKAQTQIQNSQQVKKSNLLQSNIQNGSLMTAQRKRSSVINENQNTNSLENGIVQKKENNQGLPVGLKSGIENLSGMSMDQVNVHYNSSKPNQLNALAYAQGNDIHLAPGQEKHLPHEAWHVVQQRQGKVNGTTQLKGVNINDSPQLELEADKMGDEAMKVGKQTQSNSSSTTISGNVSTNATSVVQRFDMDEHRNTGNKYFEDLFSFLQTDEGKVWAKDHGYNPKDLIDRMKADPVHMGKKLQGSDKSNPDGKPTEYEFGDPTGLMGDLFGSWEKLYGASSEQITGLFSAKSTADYQKYSKGDYLALAKKNDDHFAGKNKERWRDMHTEAINTAIAASASKDEKLLNRALFIEASGAHFLTDAFSAGHLFRKDRILAQILLDLNKQSLATTNPQMQLFASVVEMSDKTNMAQMIVKLVHDLMNKSGFDVVNGKGMKWKTFGDGNAERSPETQHMLALAVFESRQQILQAYQTGKSPEIKEVEDFFPTDDTIDRAEMQAIALIPEARKKVETLIYNERKSSPELLGLLGYPVWGMLSVIGDPGRERNFQINESMNMATGKQWNAMENILTQDKKDPSGMPPAYWLNIPIKKF